MKRGRPSMMTPRSEPDADSAPDPEPWECGLLLLKPEYDMLLFLLENGRNRAARLMAQMAEMKESSLKRETPSVARDTPGAPEEKR